MSLLDPLESSFIILVVLVVMCVIFLGLVYRWTSPGAVLITHNKRRNQADSTDDPYRVPDDLTLPPQILSRAQSLLVQFEDTFRDQSYLMPSTDQKGLLDPTSMSLAIFYHLKNQDQPTAISLGKTLQTLSRTTPWSRHLLYTSYFINQWIPQKDTVTSLTTSCWVGIAFCQLYRFTQQDTWLRSLQAISDGIHSFYAFPQFINEWQVSHFDSIKTWDLVHLYYFWLQRDALDSQFTGSVPLRFVQEHVLPTRFHSSEVRDACTPLNFSIPANQTDPDYYWWSSTTQGNTRAIPLDDSVTLPTTCEEPRYTLGSLLLLHSGAAAQSVGNSQHDAIVSKVLIEEFTADANESPAGCGSPWANSLPCSSDHFRPDEVYYGLRASNNGDGIDWATVGMGLTLLHDYTWGGSDETDKQLIIRRRTQLQNSIQRLLTHQSDQPVVGSFRDPSIYPDNPTSNPDHRVFTWSSTGIRDVNRPLTPSSQAHLWCLLGLQSKAQGSSWNPLQQPSAW